jgi:hypothetical protein
MNPLIVAIAFLTPTPLIMDTAQSFQELELRVQTEKAAYAVGESIFLDISLLNTGSKKLKTLRYFMLPADVPIKNNLEIQVYDAAGHRLSRISHVLTGRSLDLPEIRSISPGEIYLESIQVAGTFTQGRGRKKVKLALWNFGEDAEINSINEYPVMTRGKFKIQAIYRVDKQHLNSLSESESSTIWKGQLISTPIDISIM